MASPRSNPWLDDLVAYVPGKAGSSANANIAKLSANESPLGPSPKAVEAMREAAASSHRYPDGGSSALRAAIARLHGLEPERIICGTGSDEILQLLPLAYCAPGDEVLFSRNSFMVYPIAARRAGARPIEAQDRAFTSDVDVMLAAITGKTRVIYLANPNNPTGTWLPRAEVLRLADGVPEHVILVLDGAYAEYITDPAFDCGMTLARSRPNVLITRTFSKIYGLAAERIGWGYGPRPIIDALNKIRAPFNVTTAGQAGAIAALEDQAWIEAARAHNAQWLPWLAGELQRLGLRPVPSGANFILAQVPEGTRHSAHRLNQLLGEAGFIIRYFPGGPLADCLRITVGSEAEMRGIIAALESALA